MDAMINTSNIRLDACDLNLPGIRILIATGGKD
jgi:hypothetical protein